MVGNIDTYDGQQNLEEWIRMVERTAAFAGWNADNTFKAALFRLRGGASEHIEQLHTEGHITSWEDTKKALKARYETSDREQFATEEREEETATAKLPPLFPPLFWTPSPLPLPRYSDKINEMEMIANQFATQCRLPR